MSTLYDKINYSGKPPLEDNFEHATRRQIEYIEILRVELQFSLQNRNVQILNILKREQTVGIPFDIYCLSKLDAGRVIAQFKKWKEERR